MQTDLDRINASLHDASIQGGAQIGAHLFDEAMVRRNKGKFAYKSGGTSHYKAKDPTGKHSDAEVAKWNDAVARLAFRDGISPEEASKKLADFLRTQDKKSGLPPKIGKARTAKKPKPKSRLQEDDPRPGKSPTGGKPVDFRSDGTWLYSDGAVYDANGFQKGKAKAKKKK